MMTCPMSNNGIMTLQTQRLMELELIHSPNPCEFDCNSQGSSLSERKIKVVFFFLCQSSNQDSLLDHTPCLPSSWVHLAHNERTEFIFAFSRDINSDLILPKRIGLWPLCLAGTMNTNSCASPTSWYVLRMTSLVHAMISEHPLPTRGHYPPLY